MRFIFKQLLQGDGYGVIVKDLTLRGVTTRNGGNFTTNTISTMIRNAKYKGDFIWNRSAAKDIDGKRNGHKYKPEEEWIVTKNGCPAIISCEDFDLIQERCQKNKNKFLGYKHIEEYLLTSKIVCGECGGSYVGERHWDKRHEKAYVKYGCNIKKRQGASCCPSKPIDRDELESFVLRMLAEELFCNEMKERIIGYYTQFCESKDNDKIDFLKNLNDKLKKTDRDIETLVDLITQNPLESLIGRLNRLEDEKRETTILIKTFKADNEETIINPTEVERAIMSDKATLNYTIKLRTLMNICKSECTRCEVTKRSVNTMIIIPVNIIKEMKFYLAQSIKLLTKDKFCLYDIIRGFSNSVIIWNPLIT